MDTSKKLYRSSEGRVIAGVAGGLAEYTGIDATIVRAIFLILFLAGGGGGLLYILFWALMPKDPLAELDAMSERREGFFKALAKAMLCAILLAIITGIFFEDMAAVAFVLALGMGIYYFMRGRESGLDAIGEGLGLHRSTVNKKIFGVFGGLAEKWNVDATLLRVVGVVLIFAGVGIVIPIYFLYALLVPKAASGDPMVERVVIV